MRALPYRVVLVETVQASGPVNAGIISVCRSKAEFLRQHFYVVPFIAVVIHNLQHIGSRKVTVNGIGIIPVVRLPGGLRGEIKALSVIARRQRRIRSEEHTSELQSLMRISYAVFCLK